MAPFLPPSSILAFSLLTTPSIASRIQLAEGLVPEKKRLSSLTNHWKISMGCGEWRFVGLVCVRIA
jgi:hypothetical protein